MNYRPSLPALNVRAAPTEATPLKLNTLAPNLSLTNSSGVSVALAQFWQSRPTLLFFMRHFGCAVCRAHLFRLRDRYAELQQHGGQAIAIAQGDYELTSRFTRNYRLPFPMLSNAGRADYLAFGLSDGTFDETAGPRVMLKQAQETLRGNVAYLLPGFSTGQLGGCFIVDTTSVVRFAHIARPIYNYPSVDVYLDLLDRITH